jgi:hypothetical protein
MTLDSNNMIKNQKMFKNDTILLGEYLYKRDSTRVCIKKFNESGFYSTEIQELRQDGKIECKKIYSMNNKKYDKECYSQGGMILQKLSIYNGDITQNLISIDKE